MPDDPLWPFDRPSQHPFDDWDNPPIVYDAHPFVHPPKKVRKHTRG